jgi:SAM-dependent methyltransferase
MPDTDQELRNQTRLWELIWGCAASQAIHVAAELNIPELLQERARTCDEIATATSTDAWTLGGVLRVLVASDILAIDSDDRYSLAELGKVLVKTSPSSHRGVVTDFFETIWAPLGSLMYAVQTGENAFEHALGMTFYEYLSRNAEVGSFFNQLMVKNAPARYTGLSSVYDFSKARTVVDLGGGEGGLLLHLLREQEHLQGVLFDLPDVVANAPARFEAAGLANRCKIVAGSFFDTVPTDGDVYVLANVINNFNNDGARKMLANCRDAMSAAARLLIVDALYPIGKPVLWGSLAGLGVLAQRGGRGRTESQMRTLLAATSFRVCSVKAAGKGAPALVEAAPI